MTSSSQETVNRDRVEPKSRSGRHRLRQSRRRARRLQAIKWVLIVGIPASVIVALLLYWLNQ